MRITNLEKITNENWVNLFAVRYEHGDHVGRWVFASRHDTPYQGNPCDAVVIVPILRNPGEPPRLVVIREFRVPVGDYVIGLPAGLVEKDEPIETAIEREMREETGLTVAKIHRITQPVFSSAGLTDESAALAFIDVTGHPDAPRALDPSEDIEVVLLDHAGVCRLANDRSLLVDVKAWMVLCMYQMLGKVE